MQPAEEGRQLTVRHAGEVMPGLRRAGADRAPDRKRRAPQIRIKLVVASDVIGPSAHKISVGLRSIAEAIVV